MKITKLLPLVLAAMLITPVMAGPIQEYSTGDTDNASPSADATLQLTVPSYINIKKSNAPETEIATVTNIGDDYTSMKLNKQLNATFTVVTNYKGDKVTLKGETLHASPVPALYGTADAPILVLANTTHEPSATEVASAGALGAAKDNANAIAFAVTKLITPDTTTGAAAPTAVTGPTDGVITYTLNNGKYTFDYKLNQSVNATTLSPKDEDGIYKAKLILSHVAFD